MDLCERFSFLALQFIFLSRPALADALIKEAGSASDVFRGDRKRFIQFFNYFPDLWKKFLEFEDWKNIELLSKRMQNENIAMLTRYDEEYPKLLKMIYDPPLIIMTKGDGKGLLESPCVGIVGARRATREARNMAAELAEYLSERGYCIVSGLAYGVDAAAHRGALAGSGETIGVFGCGLHMVYPASNLDLARDVMKKGLLLSEFLPGTEPFKSNFPQRNRIISGMSMAVVIVQAAQASGSLITARFALEQGREVLAVPGQGGHNSFQGSNSLIRDGAMLVERGEEILQVLERERSKWPFLKNPGHLRDDMDNDSPLLKYFPKRGSVSLDCLASKSNWELTKIFNELTRLCIEEKIEEMPGRAYRIKKEKDGIFPSHS